jgi:hypothetical protein
MYELIAHEILEVGQLLARSQFVALSIDSSLSPIVLSRNVDLLVPSRTRYESNFPEGGHWHSVPMRNGVSVPRFVQPLPDQKMLVVSESTENRECTASILSANGHVVGSFPVGIGLSHVQASADGLLWFGYSDEGIYKNHRYSGEGLICLDQEGRQRFSFTSVSEGLPTMDDCYALNVLANNEVWLSYYSEFPIVQIVNFELGNIWRKVWETGILALAVHGERVIIAGRKSRVSLWDLRSDQFLSLSVRDEAGKSIEFQKAWGRGSRLFFLSQNSLYRADLQEFRRM